ncbi:MAG TPA: hypothetical protein VFN10_09900 [Thermoanaerobaculia bacterium]|nr:hypothetical protein [Thermoanaerobaculia bacterium]
MPRTALGSLIGAAVAAALAPLLKPFFHPPTGGIGFVTVNAYPKGWDYAVVALLVLGAFAGGALLSRREVAERVVTRVTRAPQWLGALLVFLAMIAVHDHPQAPMDPFHEGEHLTPAFLFQSGERPYRDVFVLHGLATDGGLDAFVLGDPPSPHRTRRLQTILDAATLALLVPIAAEVVGTTTALACAVFASLCGMAALWVPVFPYFRLAPLLLATLGLLRYVRLGSARALLLAFCAATLGVLWSLDTGSYALGGTIVAFVLVRALKLDAKPLPLRTIALIALIAFVAPIAVLLAARADLRQFFLDSFVIIPHSIDAIWSLPVPAMRNAEALRYYLPPAFYGFLLALAFATWRRGDRLRAAQIAIVAILSVVAFRTASGRVSWSHTRFATPLLGISLVAFVLEPLLVARRRAVAIVLGIALVAYLEVVPNVTAGAKLLAGWRARQRHDTLVAYPFKTGKGIYTNQENANELAALNGFLASLGPHDVPILDFSNERALYYLLQRKPPMRCFDIPMLAAPPLLAEAMAELNAHPPVAVVLEATAVLGAFDGVSNRDRVPELAAWIDAGYPKRTRIGRFLVATR